MQRLGQHFLKNQAAIEKIVTSLELKKNETVVEVGPGHGELTLPLAEACKKIGCNIIAIERDAVLAKDLAKNFQFSIFNFQKDSPKNIPVGQSCVVEGDALKILPEICFALHASRFKIVGNIPYYITGHLLRVVGELERHPEISIFTIQKEVAERVVAAAPEMNKLAASVQFWAEPKLLGFLGKNDFIPPPNVDSAVIELKARNRWDGADAEKYYLAVRMLFAQPRKTILNNLSAKQNARALPKEKIVESLKKIGVRSEDRPQNLTVEQIVEISRLF